MPALLRDMGKSISPWLPRNEIQKQNLPFGIGSIKFGKAVHVVCPETKKGKTMTTSTNYYASISHDAQANHLILRVFLLFFP